MHTSMKLFAFILTAATISAPAFAVIPASGLWVVDGELNGKPGRGVQVDTQGGEIMIVSYFGYKPSGESAFMQAVGKLDENNFFSADLIEYKNGTTLTGGVQEAEVAKNHGKMTLQLSSSTEGVMRLPGVDTEKKIKRFAYENIINRLNDAFRTTILDRDLPDQQPPYSAKVRSGYISMSTDGIDLKINLTFDDINYYRPCDLTAPLSMDGDNYSAVGFLNCDADPTKPDQKF